MLREDIAVALDERVTLLLSTTAEVDNLVEQLAKARTLLEQQAHARTERARLLGTATGLDAHVRVIPTVPWRGDVA